MTKRKRDIFTVIESINNWFEASEHYTNLPSDHEDSSSNSNRTTGPGTRIEIDCQAAESGTPTIHTEHSHEAGYKSPNCHPGHVGLEVTSELAREITNRPSDGPRSATRTKRVAEYGEEAAHEGEPGNPTLDTA